MLIDFQRLGRSRKVRVTGNENDGVLEITLNPHSINTLVYRSPNIPEPTPSSCRILFVSKHFVLFLAWVSYNWNLS
jgi:hypothetical protein